MKDETALIKAARQQALELNHTLIALTRHGVKVELDVLNHGQIGSLDTPQIQIKMYKEL